MFKTSLLTDSSISISPIIVKYDKIDDSKKDAGKLIKKLLKEQKISKAYKIYKGY